MAKLKLVTTLGLFASMALGCGSLKELVEGKQEPAVEPTPEVVVTEQPPAAAPWRVLLVLDRTTDRSFDHPGPALEASLASTDVQLVQVYDANPVELKGADGAVRGRVEVATITDEQTGYIFAEEGRPPTYLAPAGLAVVLQQAGAYFDTTFERPARPGGEGPFGEGKTGKLSKGGKIGHPMSPDQRKGAKIKARQAGAADETTGAEKDGE